MYRQNTADNWDRWWFPHTAAPTYDYNINTYWYTCPQCAKLVQWGSVYCPSCGAKLIQEETEGDKLDRILQKLDEIIQSLSEKVNGDE